MSTLPPRPLNEIPEIEPVPLMPYHIAFVLDGVVQQVFHVEERVASVLLSNPTIAQCEDTSKGGPDRGWSYNPATGSFAKPVDTQ